VTNAGQITEMLTLIEPKAAVERHVLPQQLGRSPIPDSTLDCRCFLH